MFTQTFAALLTATATAAEWNYNQMGADWGRSYPLCDNGREQSPVDLNGLGLKHDADMHLTGFDYQNYDTRTIVNNGHTL